MKRTPITRKTPLQARTPLTRSGGLQPVSTKRRADNRAYARLRAAFLTAHPICELCGVKPANELHHKAGRVGALLLDTTRWAALDSDCHRWVTEHPAEAYASGISERRIA